MKVLALEPYDGGSHRAFLAGWRRHSRHDFTVLGLPAHSWKWRMRHAAVTLAGQVSERWAAGQRWDVIFASDMLNLAEFRGLAPVELRRLPAVAYFHENQLTYPVRVADERDYHFGVSNLVTALAADAVWFNSIFHRDAFLAALGEFLTKMPDYRLRDEVASLPAKCDIQYPGIEAFPRRTARRRAGPLRIVWAARWEHDKDPAALFAALDQLVTAGVDFRISVLGESFQQSPAEFAAARVRLGDRVAQWGYVADRGAYRRILGEADVVVSTAQHEFFGISIVEAMAAGAAPLVPHCLAYPEVLGPELAHYLYEPGPVQLAAALKTIAERLMAGEPLSPEIEAVQRRGAEFAWPRRAEELDAALQTAAQLQSE